MIPPTSVVRRAVRGAIAGAVGTAAMDLVWYARYRRGGGDRSVLEWEFSKGLTWDNAPAPAQVGKKAAKALLGADLPDQAAPRVNNAVHWSTGAMWGAAYGVVLGRHGRRPPVQTGLVFGPAVCATSYVVLPLMKLYKPIWQYDAKTLFEDFSAHTVFGLTTAAVLAGRRGSAARRRWWCG